jgi:hypothetical protein
VVEKEITVAVTGGRGYTDKEKVFDVLDQVLKAKGIRTVVEGGCPTGADAHTRQWAGTRGVFSCTCNALWESFGMAAGPVRNRAMLKFFSPDVLIAFPGNRGTRNCISAAVDLGVHVVRIEGRWE